MPKRSYKGPFVPTNPNKYKGDLRNIVFRSLWERSFMKFCDTHPAVLAWSSETIVIPYHSSIKRGVHRYFVDFYAEMKDKNGNVKKYLIEVKPYKETLPPKQPKSYKTKAYADAVREYVTNQDKWKSAREWCDKNGMIFQVLTEKELYGNLGLEKEKP